MTRESTGLLIQVMRVEQWAYEMMERRSRASTVEAGGYVGEEDTRLVWEGFRAARRQFDLEMDALRALCRAQDRPDGLSETDDANDS